MVSLIVRVSASWELLVACCPPTSLFFCRPPCFPNDVSSRDDNYPPLSTFPYAKYHFATAIKAHHTDNLKFRFLI